MNKLAIASVAVVVLTGCAAQPVDGGFSETRLEDDVFRVSFRGDEHTSRVQAERMALVRGADLVSRGGYRYFAIVDGLARENGASPAPFGNPSPSPLPATVTYTLQGFKERPSLEKLVFDTAVVCRAVGATYGAGCASPAQ